MQIELKAILSGAFAVALGFAQTPKNETPLEKPVKILAGKLPLDVQRSGHAASTRNAWSAPAGSGFVNVFLKTVPVTHLTFHLILFGQPDERVLCHVENSPNVGRL